MNLKQARQEMGMICKVDLIYQEEPHDLLYRSLDIFERTLTIEEAFHQMISYPVLKRGRQDMSVYFEKEKELLKLFKEVFNTYAVFSCHEEGHSQIMWKAKFLRRIRSMLRESKRKTFHIPQLGLTILSNFDLDTPCYFDTQEGLDTFSKLVAKRKGLYMRG